ncbi:class I SAM-dependent methyltransferase [Scytonema tolypothrichoides VB-61278]|nr:class I SAM-dependent methyltransferase [Scytonema tolypothrichoides VB-61278]
MFDLIIQKAKETEYDFRKNVYPNEQLEFGLNHWIDYYKLKWSIAHILKPSSILEIGVSFGYCAAAFLHGHPAAHYVGLLDIESYKSLNGVIDWAKKITTPFATEFMMTDTQAMKRLPGDIYDLIHVDRQRNEDAFFHNLKLAIHQGRYVLLDGYLDTQQSFLAINCFLFRYANILDWYGVIPGYSGQLLIKVSEDYLRQVKEEQQSNINSSLEIRQTYTSEYYTQDCGGYDAYEKNQGKKLEDPRLKAIATIASLKQSGRVLDLGCGRGELSFYFAHRGFKVTAVDYSPNAIELAKKCFDGKDQLKEKVEFICHDVCHVPLSGKYDLVLASDVIEHLSFEEVDTLYQKMARHLQPDGLFVVHTFPNLWYYKYHYQRKRKIAASVGAYLPAEPRSRYELLMHINEQSPRILKKQLSKYFKNVLLWFGDPENPGGNIVRNFSIRELSAAPSLFAIASHKQINQEQLKNSLQICPLPAIPSGQIKIIVMDSPREANVSSEFEIQLAIENNSDYILNSFGSYPVHIAYHWMNAQASECLVFDGERTGLFPPLQRVQNVSQSFLRGQKAKEILYTAKVKALPEKGDYVLRVTLVQENVRWFDNVPTQLMKDIFITLL